MLPSRRIVWLSFALLLVALPCAASAASADPAGPFGPGAVRLLEPADGTVLPGGSTVTLAWEPGAAMDLGRVAPDGPDGPDGVTGVKEWEAFLSLDGGATWPVRITPHLDISLRRVKVPVPALPADDVRLLLRVGDERNEVPVDVPGRFSIAARPGALLPSAAARYDAGESALPGGRGVVAWVEGTRQGRDLRSAVTLPVAGGWTGVELVPVADLWLAAEPEPPSDDLVPPLGALTASPVPTPPAERARPRPRPAPPGARAILLAIARLDE